MATQKTILISAALIALGVAGVGEGVGEVGQFTGVEMEQTCGGCVGGTVGDNLGDGHVGNPLFRERKCHFLHQIANPQYPAKTLALSRCNASPRSA